MGLERAARGQEPDQSAYSRDEGSGVGVGDVPVRESVGTFYHGPSVEGT